MSLVRFLPAWLHAIADYAVAATLIVVPLAVGGADKAVGTGVAVGAVVALVSMMTKYPLGVVKVLPFTEAYAMVERHEVDNAVAVVALQWLALHRDEVRKRWR